jgi:hypothetical protein
MNLKESMMTYTDTSPALAGNFQKALAVASWWFPLLALAAALFKDAPKPLRTQTRWILLFLTLSMALSYSVSYLEAWNAAAPYPAYAALAGFNTVQGFSVTGLYALVALVASVMILFRSRPFFFEDHPRWRSVSRTLALIGGVWAGALLLVVMLSLLGGVTLASAPGQSVAVINAVIVLLIAALAFPKGRYWGAGGVLGLFGASLIGATLLTLLFPTIINHPDAARLAPGNLIIGLLVTLIGAGVVLREMRRRY